MNKRSDNVKLNLGDVRTSWLSMKHICSILAV